MVADSRECSLKRLEIFETITAQTIRKLRKGCWQLTRRCEWVVGNYPRRRQKFLYGSQKQGLTSLDEFVYGDFFRLFFTVHARRISEGAGAPIQFVILSGAEGPAACNPIVPIFENQSARDPARPRGFPGSPVPRRAMCRATGGVTRVTTVRIKRFHLQGRASYRHMVSHRAETIRVGAAGA